MFIVTNLMSALVATLCFYVSSQPNILSQIDSGLLDASGCVTGMGHVTQTGIFLFLVLILSLLIIRNKSVLQILMYSLMAGLLFFVLSDVNVYQFVDKYVGYGYTCNSTNGLILHSIVYGLLVYVGSLIL